MYIYCCHSDARPLTTTVTTVRYDVIPPRSYQALSLQVIVRLLIIHVTFGVFELFGPLRGVLLCPSFLLETLGH
jgi:hypothetical protein